MAKVVLGKGLGALINTPKAPSLELGDRVERVALAEIVPSPLQPRKNFQSDQLQELIDSKRALIFSEASDMQGSTFTQRVVM